MDLLMAHCVKHGEDYKYDHKDFVFPFDIFRGTAPEATAFGRLA
jgi:hypothetical protein